MSPRGPLIGPGSYRGQKVLPAPPPVEMPPEMIAMTCTHLVGVPEVFEKPITYCFTEDGKVFEVRKTRIGLVCKAPTKILGAHGRLKEGFQMTLPKIPFSMLATTVAFFRGVCDKFKDRSLEAIVQFWFDPSKEIYFFIVPDQSVSAGGVDHRGDFDPEGKFIHVADVHSHGRSMSAFWSGTDDADECKAERLYGVIGNVKDAMPTMKFRTRTDGAFIDLQPPELFDLPEEALQVKVSLKDLLLGKDLKASVDLFGDQVVPPDWYEQVKPRAYTQVVGSSFGDPSFRVVDRRGRSDAHLGGSEEEWPISAGFGPEKKSFLLWHNGEIIEVDLLHGEQMGVRGYLGAD